MWYRVVGFGPAHYPRRAYKSKVDVMKARLRYSLRNQCSYTLANTRIYEYRTRREAREGDISDQIGQHGRIG